MSGALPRATARHAWRPLARRGLALSLAAVATLLGACASVAAPPPGPDRFEFVAIGDMPYGDRNRTWPAYTQLIGQINALKPAFTIHVGDFKSGSSKCSDEEFAAQLGFFNRIAGALVYTPGDNEWTDCHRPAAGAYDPIERLATLRRQFFPEPRSLGQQPIALQRQADLMPAFAGYPENARFVRAGVLVVTLHIVGSNNNFEARDPKATAEFFARDDANVAWIRAAFDEARRIDAKAVVFAMQADPFESKSAWDDFPSHSGFARSVGETLVPLAAAWGKPVLFLHGDSHVFRWDRPFHDDKKRPVRNLMRLEVFGAPDIHGVRVTVDPSDPAVFSVAPLWNQYFDGR